LFGNVLSLHYATYCSCVMWRLLHIA
jgi:hypothetical protein